MAGSDNGSAVTSLALSDIIRTLSPSPGPQKDRTPAPNGTGSFQIVGGDLQTTPTAKPIRNEDDQQEDPVLEPLTEEEVVRCRTRLVEMGLLNEAGKLVEDRDLNSREKALLDMVGRLQCKLSVVDPLILLIMVALGADSRATPIFDTTRCASTDDRQPPDNARAYGVRDARGESAMGGGEGWVAEDVRGAYFTE